MSTFLTIFVLCAVACAMAAPAPGLRNLPALYHKEIHDDFGQYALRYVTAEGIMVSERGHLELDHDGKDYVLIIEGEVSYVGDDGKTYVTKYKSGFDGFEASGDHFPVQGEPLPAPAVVV